MYNIEDGLDDFMEGVDKEALFNFMQDNMADALRIINTRIMFPEDQELLYKSLCITTGIFFKKSANHEFDEIRQIH